MYINQFLWELMVSLSALQMYIISSSQSVCVGVCVVW